MVKEHAGFLAFGDELLTIVPKAEADTPAAARRLEGQLHERIGEDDESLPFGGQDFRGDRSGCPRTPIKTRGNKPKRAKASKQNET